MAGEKGRNFHSPCWSLQAWKSPEEGPFEFLRRRHYYLAAGYAYALRLSHRSGFLAAESDLSG